MATWTSSTASSSARRTTATRMRAPTRMWTWTIAPAMPKMSSTTTAPRHGMPRPSRRTSASRKPLRWQWTIARSTSSLCGMASPSSYESRRWRRGGQRLPRPRRRAPRLLLHPRHGIRGHRRRRLPLHPRGNRGCRRRRFPFLLFRQSTSCNGGQRSSTWSATTSSSMCLGFSGPC